MTENLMTSEFQSIEAPKLKNLDDTLCYKLRRQLDDIIRANHAKQERLDKLAKEFVIDSNRTTPKTSRALGQNGPKDILEKIKETEVKISEELVNQTSLNFMKSRIEKEKLVHYERLIEIRRVATRITSNFEEAKRTEASSVNHLTIVKNDAILLQRTREEMRHAYGDEIKKHRDLHKKESNEVHAAIERMSYKTVIESEKFTENKQRLELLEKRAILVKERSAMLARETTKVNHYRSLLRRIVPIAESNGFAFEPDASDFESIMKQVLKLYTMVKIQKSSLEMRFKEISEDQLAKRNQCDEIKAELDMLKNDNLDLINFKVPHLYSASDLKDQIRLTRERLKLKQMTTADYESLLIRLFLSFFQLSSLWMEFIRATVEHGRASYQVSLANHNVCQLVDQLKRSFKLEDTFTVKTRSNRSGAAKTPTPFITEVDLKQTEATMKSVFLAKFPNANREVVQLSSLLSSSNIVCLFISTEELEVFLQKFSTIEEAARSIPDVFVAACNNLLQPSENTAVAIAELFRFVGEDLAAADTSLKITIDRLQPKAEESFLPILTKSRSTIEPVHPHILKLKADLGYDMSDELPRIRPEVITILKSKGKDADYSSLPTQYPPETQKTIDEQRTQMKNKLLNRRSEPSLDLKALPPRPAQTSNRPASLEYERIRDFKQIYDSLTSLRQKDKLARTLPTKHLKPPTEAWRSIGQKRTTEELLKGLYCTPDSTFKTEKSRSTRLTR